MEPKDSLTDSQEPATGPYPESDASSPHLPLYFPEIHYIILPSMPRWSRWSLPFRFSNQNIICPSSL